MEILVHFWRGASFLYQGLLAISTCLPLCEGRVISWSWALYYSSGVLHFDIEVMAQIAAKQCTWVSCSIYAFPPTPKKALLLWFLFYSFCWVYCQSACQSICRRWESSKSSEYVVIIQLEEEFNLFPVMLAAPLWLHYAWAPSHAWWKLDWNVPFFYCSTMS